MPEAKGTAPTVLAPAGVEEFDRSQAEVHTDPVLKALATSFMACGPEHYAGSGTGDPTVLEWAAWDAYHALTTARLNLDGDTAAAVVAALENTMFTGTAANNRQSPCLAAHVAAVLEAARA